MAPKTERTKMQLPSRPSDEGDSALNPEHVRFSHTAALRRSSGNIQEAEVPSYTEAEEGQGERYRKRAKLERQRQKKRQSHFHLHKADDRQEENAAADEKEESIVKRAAKAESQPRKPEKRRKSDPKDPGRSELKKDLPVVQHGGSFEGKEFEKVLKNRPRPPEEKIVHLSIGRGSFGRAGGGGQKDNLGLGQQETQKTPKAGLIRRLTNSLRSSLSGQKVNRISRNSRSERDTESGMDRDMVQMHRMDPETLKDVGQRLSRQMSANDDPNKMAEDDDSILDDQVMDNDDQQIMSFVSILGVDSIPPYRETTDTETDQSRIEDQTLMSLPAKTTNAAMLNGMNLDLIDNYEESFMGLWDLDSGRELLSYMNTQTDNYLLESRELEQENEKMETELNKMRRRKQDGYFQIKDNEAQAAEAERRYRQLIKLRPKKLNSKTTSLSEKETTEKLAALLEQRVELLCYERDIYRKLDEDTDKVRQEEYKIDKLFHRAVRHHNETIRRLQYAHRESTDKKADLAVVQQELAYLTEEIGLYIFEDDQPRNLSVEQAFKHLSSQNDDLLPIHHSDPSKRMAMIEETLEKMKRDSEAQIRQVDDAHDQMQFHVSRRGDILRNLVQKFMQDNEIVRIDPKVWYHLQAQQANGSLLQEQVDAQLSVSQLYDSKWHDMKDSNSKLRAELDRLKNSQAKRRQTRDDATLTDDEDSDPELRNHPPRRPALRDFAEVEVASQTSRELFNIGSEEEIWDELSMKDSVSWREDPATLDVDSQSDDWLN